MRKNEGSKMRKNKGLEVRKNEGGFKNEIKLKDQKREKKIKVQK